MTFYSLSWWTGKSESRWHKGDFSQRRWLQVSLIKTGQLWYLDLYQTRRELKENSENFEDVHYQYRPCFSKKTKIHSDLTSFSSSVFIDLCRKKRPITTEAMNHTHSRFPTNHTIVLGHRIRKCGTSWNVCVFSGLLKNSQIIFFKNLCLQTPKWQHKKESNCKRRVGLKWSMTQGMGLHRLFLL